MYHSLETRIWFTIIFLPLKESYSVRDMDFFAIRSFIFSHLELPRIKLLKVNSSVLMEVATVPVILVGQFYFYMHQSILSLS